MSRFRALSWTLGLMAVAGTSEAQSRPRPAPATGERLARAQQITSPGGILAQRTPVGPPSSCPPRPPGCRPPGPICPPIYDIPPPIVIIPGGSYFEYMPPPIAFGPSMVPLVSPDPGFGVAGPPPSREMVERWQGPPAKPPKRSDPARAEHLVTLGDRLFRAGNSRRAGERYEQAVRSDPNAAAPRIGLAKLALGRGQYAEAADHIREALTAQPGWLIHAPDISATYGEPAEFAEEIAKLESHVQARPSDRDAWFVLGAQWYLSGQTKRAADVFLRLTDRKPDPTLEAFLDASASKNQGE